MYGITDLTTYLIGVVLIVLLPGPNTLMVLSIASGRGMRAGLVSSVAVTVGDSLLMVLAAAGMASLLTAFSSLYLAFKIVGAAYLAWIGVGMLREVIQAVREGAELPQSLPGAQGSVFWRGVLISVMNPKSILFYLSFFIQFVDPGYAHTALSFAILGLLTQSVSLAWLVVLVFAGHRLAEMFRARKRLLAGAKTATGTLFLAFSAKLALTG